MNGYPKIKFINSTKSRSIDFSDFSSFPPTPKPFTNTSPNTVSKSQQNKNTKTRDSFSEQEDEERFGVTLRRNCSVSSASSHRFRFDKQSNALKRAFSMRRSSSVSERYCRIHDQSVALLASPTDDDEGVSTTRSVKTQHRGGKILKVCKRFFGL